MERHVHIDVNHKRAKHKPLYSSSTTKIHYNFRIGDPSAGGRLKHFSFHEQIPNACFNLDISTSNSVVSQWYEQLTVVCSNAILDNGAYSCLMCLKLPFNRGVAARLQTMVHLNSHPIRPNEEWKKRPVTETAQSHQLFPHEVADFADLGAFLDVAAEKQWEVMGGTGPTATTICIPICGSAICRKTVSDMWHEYRNRVGRRLK